VKTAAGRSGFRLSATKVDGLLARAFAVPASGPATGPTLAFLQLLAGPANATFSGFLLLCVLDPANELIAGQRRDVIPGIERRRMGDQRVTEVFRKFVYDPTADPLAAHATTLASIADDRMPAVESHGAIARLVASLPSGHPLRESDGSAAKEPLMMRAFSCLLVFGFLGCGGGDEEDSPTTPQSDFRSLVHGLFSEYMHEVEVSCPCRVEEGAFASMAECLHRLGLGPSFPDCVSEELQASDSPELRSALSCSMQQYKLRADCLDSHSCKPEYVAPCYEQVLDCPVLDPQALTRALRECPNGPLPSR
jgi:hypothetical protein